jgi:dihydroorotate dehydrogenase (fumarate)
MDLSTTYMGLKLKNPLVVSSSKLTGSIKSIKDCVANGAGAIVLKSLFEEQIRAEAETTVKHSNNMYYWFPEAKDHIMGLSMDTKLDKYLDFVSEVKKEVDVPVISSINCSSPNEWPKFASAIQKAGADAIELNIGIFPFNDSLQGNEIEDIYVNILKEVNKNVTIPVAIKIGYYFTNISSIATKLVESGVDALVLFNRYMRPDIDINTLKVIDDNNMSSSEELNISMRWIALLTGNKIGCQLAASTGVHDHTGVIKQLLSGASVVQLCSTLYLNGLVRIGEIENGLKAWMKEHKFKSIDDFRGKSVHDKTTLASFERIQFMKRDME